MPYTTTTMNGLPLDFLWSGATTTTTTSATNNDVLWNQATTTASTTDNDAGYWRAWNEWDGAFVRTHFVWTCPPVNYVDDEDIDESTWDDRHQSYYE